MARFILKSGFRNSPWPDLCQEKDATMAVSCCLGFAWLCRRIRMSSWPMDGGMLGLQKICKSKFTLKLLKCQAFCWGRKLLVALNVPFLFITNECHQSMKRMELERAQPGWECCWPLCRRVKCLSCEPDSLNRPAPPVKGKPVRYTTLARRDPRPVRR